MFTSQQYGLPQQSQQQQSVLNVCQSGIREDNTNYIYCARRNLNEIPIFSKNNVVYDELVLTDNRIAKLTSNSFARIKVKKIYLNGNPIRSIDQMTFSKLENHLEELWLDADSTAIQSPIDLETESIQLSSVVGLPKAIVNYLRNLNTLRLKGLLVKVLENSVLKRLNRIEILSLQFCSIEKIEINAFDGLRNSLKELYLDGNLLQTVPTDALNNANFKSLKVLSLSQNNIKTINSDSFGYNYFNLNNNFDNSILKQDSQFSSTFNNLVKLDLSYNGLKLIDSQSFNNFNNTLEILYLQNNEINSYNLKFLRQLNMLKELNFDFNLITKLNSNLFVNSKRLQFLSLQGNSIVFDDIDTNAYSLDQSVFEGLVGLQRLNLARNGIKHLPDHLFKPMSQLKSLILDKNAIDNFNENTFDGLYSSLMNISLQNTKMKSKHLLSLKNLEKIERIKLGFNDIDSIDWSLFSKMSTSLSNLDLQNNQIETIIYDESLIPNSNLTMENLFELDLSNNKLCEFNSNLINKLPKLKNLGLAQNPLYCDCRLLQLYEWTIKKYDKDMLMFIQWQCEVPNQQRNQLDDDLEEQNFNYFHSNDKKINYRKFTSLAASDFVCNNSTSSLRCPHVKLAAQNPTQKPSNFITKSASSSINLNFMSTKSSIQSQQSTVVTPSSSYVVDSDFIAAPTSKNAARISNIQLTSASNSVLVDWELDVSDLSLLNDIKGFKINYNQLKLDETLSSISNQSLLLSISGSSTESSSTSFLVDKNQRKFKIDNLNFNSRYTICVSILRYQGYDKYCRDIDIPASNLNKVETENLKKYTKKIVKDMNSSVSSSPTPSSLSSVSASINNQNSHFISSLMITLLVLLVCFIMALIIFVYIYVKKCRKNQNKIIKNKSLMNTMNSCNYTGAILSNSTLKTIKNSNCQTLNANMMDTQNNLLTNKYCCGCDTIKFNPNHTINPKFIGLVTTNGMCMNNHIQAQQIQMLNQKSYQSNPNDASVQISSCSSGNHQNGNFCSCIRTGANECNTHGQNLNIGDTSTVSSTLSSVNTSGVNQIKNQNEKNDILNISPKYNTHEQTSWQFNPAINTSKDSAITMSTASSDLSSSPTSFTHFILNNNPQQQTQQIQMGYIPYEIYNCIQNSSNSNKNTLIVPINQINANTLLNSKKLNPYEKNKIGHLLANSNMANLNNMVNQFNNNANSDHVYCEIPSTLGRCYQQNSNLINNINSFNQLNNKKLIESNQNQIFSQQNSSASLLLSSSSSQSSQSTSPQSSLIQPNNSKFSASII